jgi:hypothetical protein
MTSKPRKPANLGSDDLIDWLQDAGRRKAPKPPAPASEPAQAPAPAAARRSRAGRTRPILLGALAAVAALQYVYADVFLQIAKLPSLIVFVSVP